MLKTLVILVGSIATLSAGPAFGGARYQEAVIQQIKITPENAGVNPDAYAYQIEAKVLLGSNVCTASGMTAQISKRIAVGALHITALKRIPQGRRPACIQIWAPVYKTIKTRITGFRSRTGNIFVHNVGELGSVKNIEQLLEPSKLTSVKGTLSRVMAVGGESTGYAVMTNNGDLVEVDLKEKGLHRRFEEFEDRRVVVSGKMTKKKGVEIAERSILIVEDIRILD